MKNNVQRFYSLCLKRGKKPNPVGKEIGLSSGIISKWKAGGIPNGETLMKLSKYFDVSIDYLLGISPHIEIKETDIEPIFSDSELKDRILNNAEILNGIGLSYLAEYSDYLVTKTKYRNVETISFKKSDSDIDNKL